MSRWAVARRLQELALRIAGGRPLRVGSRSARVGDRVVVEEELESSGGAMEFEFELRWLAGPSLAPAKVSAPTRGRRRGTR